MSDKQTLAREILELVDGIIDCYKETETRKQVYVSFDELKLFKQLAQLVLEEDFEVFQSHMDSITTAISIEEEIAKARQEQKEKDAKIVIEMGKYQDPEKIAKKIRASF